VFAGNTRISCIFTKFETRFACIFNDLSQHANRRAAIEGTIDADPVAACVREIMADRSWWTGSAADLLRLGAASSSSNGIWRDRAGWPAASGAHVPARTGHRDYVQS
jgi:hypothetical protein